MRRRSGALRGNRTIRNIQGGKLRTEVQTWLRNWFESRAKIGKHANPPAAILDVDYFEAGWLTSMEVVELITEIERQFCIQFSEEDMQDRRLVTIAGLTELILQRSSESSEVR
jgi:acyl carrier protein